MTGSNETVCTIKNENENENQTAIQVKAIFETPQEKGTNITDKNNDPQWTNIGSAMATSTVLKDFIIDINGLQPTKSRIEKYVVYRLLFINLLGKIDKKEKDDPLHGFQIQKSNTAWVQFSIFQSSGFSSSSGFSGSIFTSCTSGSSSKSSDNGINYEPGKRNNYILIVLSITTLMWFLNAICLYIIFNSDFLCAVFKEPGVFLTSLEFGILIRCYFWFICMPKPRHFFLCLIPLSLTLITVIGISAMISVDYQTDVILNGSFVIFIITIFLLILSVTCFNLRSIFLYLHCIILAFLLAMVFIVISVYVTGEPYTTKHMLILVSAVVAQASASVMELQGIINGTSIAQLDDRDYILGSFLLFTSLVTLVINFAKCVGLYKNYIK